MNKAVNSLDVDLFIKIRKLTNIGIALSAEKNPGNLLEQIVTGAMELTGADGGTLYLLKEDQQLHFEIIVTRSLSIRINYRKGGESGFKTIPLYLDDESPNLHNVAAHAVLKQRTINIPDAYSAKGFDFSGTKRFDSDIGYRSQSFLTVPLKNHEGDIIAVLQLINKVDAQSKRITHFTLEDQRLAESLASQAAVALTNNNLMAEMKGLFESFIHLLANAIDDKSPYTGGHCRRVPILTMLLADAAHHATEGPLSDFVMTDQIRYELEVAAWLHDCGKIITPDYVVDKATKLETIYDGIDFLRLKYEILKRDQEIARLKSGAGATYTPTPDTESTALEQELAFLAKSNIGGEFMSDADIEKIRQISRRTLSVDGKEEPLLSEKDVTNLSIRRGTLNDQERKIVNRHIEMTIKMLNELPFPKHLQNVPEYAGGHHERMDGKGYPNGLTREQMSIPARIMAIADIFEALTAKDRPYKKAKPLSEALTILGRMKLDNHIDPDLFDVFIRDKVYLAYAEQYLEAHQMDEFDINTIPGVGKQSA